MTLPLLGKTLYQAARNGDLETVKLLINAGAQADEQSSLLITPLHASAVHNQLPVAEYLITEVIKGEGCYGVMGALAVSPACPLSTILWIQE